MEMPKVSCDKPARLFRMAALKDQTPKGLPAYIVSGSLLFMAGCLRLRFVHFKLASADNLPGRYGTDRLNQLIVGLKYQFNVLATLLINQGMGFRFLISR